MNRDIIRLFHILALSTFALGSFLDGDIDLADGVKLVSIPVSNSIEDGGRSFGKNSVMFRLAKFLQGHALHISLPNLIEKEKVTQAFAESLKAVDENNMESSAGTGRGKGDGSSGIALLGLLFAKALGAAGIGGVGLLTAKALSLSALALLLSAVVGVKKLTSHDDHDDHQVIYAGHGHGHHRRRRHLETPLPYQGWREYQKNQYE